MNQILALAVCQNWKLCIVLSCDYYLWNSSTSGQCIPSCQLSNANINCQPISWESDDMVGRSAHLWSRQ